MKRLSLIMVFTIFITSCSGLLTVYAQEAQKQEAQQENAPSPQRTVPNAPRMMIHLMDMNNDGQISEVEYRKFFADADQDKNGFITAKEIADLISRKLQEVNGPNMGEMAPDFALRTLDGDKDIKLSDFRDKLPVVLVFGSYT